MVNMVDTVAISKFLEEACTHYDRTAPTVTAYLEDLYARVGESPADVRLIELLRVGRLREEGLDRKSVV